MLALVDDVVSAAHLDKAHVIEMQCALEYPVNSVGGARDVYLAVPCGGQLIHVEPLVRHAGMSEEFIVIHVGHQNVKVHIGAALGILEKEHLLITPCKERLCQLFHSRHARPLAAAYGNALIGEREHVAALDGAAAVVIIEQIDFALAELFTVLVQISYEKRFAHARGHVHG